MSTFIDKPDLGATPKRTARTLGLNGLLRRESMADRHRQHLRRRCRLTKTFIEDSAMTAGTHDPAKRGSPALGSLAALDSFEIALTEHEFHLARILEFDPDANVPRAGDHVSLSPDAPLPTFVAVSGSAFSHATWIRLSASCCVGDPAEALDAFLLMRARLRS
jgi:hypothetical protein